MAEGSIRVGNAYITITPDLNEAQLQAQLDKAKASIARFSGERELLAKQTARLEAKLQAWVTAQYGAEAAKRVAAEKAAIEARKKLSGTETASYLKALGTVTTAHAAELAKQEKRQAEYSKYVRTSNERIAAQEAKDIAASASAVRAGLAAKEKAQAAFERSVKAHNARVAAQDARATRAIEAAEAASLRRREREQAASLRKKEKEQAAYARYVEASNARIAKAERAAIAESAAALKAARAEEATLLRAREARITTMSRLVIRQASMEAAAQAAAARTAQAAYTSAFNTRQAQILSTMEMQRASQLQATQATLAQAKADKQVAQNAIRQSNDTRKALTSNARDVNKSWTKATLNMGGKLGRLGTQMTEFGRTVQRSFVTPLAAAAGALSYFGIKAADSIVQSQTALSSMGVGGAASQKQLEELQRFGTKTPYSVEDMFTYGAQYTRALATHTKGYYSEDAKKRAEAAGKASQQATELVEAIGNLAAFGGVTDAAQVERAMSAVAKSIDSGRVSAVTLKQLANNAGLPLQEMATIFGFTDRAYSEKDLKAKRALAKKKGVTLKFKEGDEYSAAAQMRDWITAGMQTGGISGTALHDMLIERGKDIGSGDPNKAPAERLGGATISARIANMGEQAKYSLSDLFISPVGEGKNKKYEYTGAGKALMGTKHVDKNGKVTYEGGLLNTVSDVAKDLKNPSGKVVQEFFEGLTTFTDWIKKTVGFLKDHPAITDMVIKVGKFAAVIGAAALALGTLAKLFGFITKVMSPLAGLVKGTAKTVGQATGIRSQTDAQKEASELRDHAKAQAKRDRKEARGAAKAAKRDAIRAARTESESDEEFNERRARAKREAKQARRAANQSARTTRTNARNQAQDIRRHGRDSTSYADRYRERRANLSGGDDRSVATRAVDKIRGRNSQVEKIDLDTEEAKKKIRELESFIEGMKSIIDSVRSKDFKPLADELAGKDGSVQAMAQKAEKAFKDSERAAETLKGLKLSALNSEFNSAAEKGDKFKSSTHQGEVAVSELNQQKLNHVGGEFNETKQRVKLLIAAVKSGMTELNQLDEKTLSNLKSQISNVKDEAEDTSKKVGSGESSLNSRIAKLNSLETGKIVKQIDNLKEKLKDTATQATTLNTQLGNISSHAPSGKNPKTTKPKKTNSATGGVLPGYTPGADVHHFVSPTAGSLHLSGGEAVMRPEWTEAVGPGFVNQMNMLARTQGSAGVRKAMRFAGGGVLGKLGLDQLTDMVKNFQIGPDVLGAVNTMTMDSTSRGLGGAAQKGVVGSGTDGSHFIGRDLADKFKGIFDFMTRDSWDILKKIPIPDGWTQLIGTIGGAIGPTAGTLFWDDVWKGNGNVLDRGGKFLNDLLSWDSVKSVVGDLFGGAWDSAKSLVSGGKALFTDPIGFVQDGVSGMWDMAEAEYNGVISMVKSAREIWNNPMDYASQVVGDIYSTAKDSLPNLKGLFDFGDGGVSAVKPDMADKIAAMISEPGSGDNVTRWTPQVKMALAQLGLPADALKLVLHRIGVESGGNPNAINNWDSNAKAGYPSQGLMQTIPQTFKRWAGPYLSRGITDPMANIYAGLNYAVHRYSDWRKALSGNKGYATGTDGAAKGWAWVGEEGPELVNFGGGETVLSHRDSMLSSARVRRGYASGTGSTRTTGVAADAEKGVSSLNSAVKKLYAIITQAFTSGKIGSGTANSLNKWLDGQNKELQKLVKARADIAPKLKEANKKLTDIKKDEADMADSISDKSKGMRSLTDIFNDSGISTSSALSSLKQRLSAIKSFQSDITALTKKGFSKEIIAEIAQAGPEQGDAMAKELLNSTDAQMADFNKTYKAIGTASDSLGKSVAGSYYKAGRESAQALVDGLTEKDNKLKKAIEGIADTITKTLKKRLGVNSKTPVSSGLAALLTWLTGESQAVKGGGSTSATKKKTTTVTTTYSTDSKGRKVTTVTTTVRDPAKGTTTTTTERTVGGKTTTSTRTSHTNQYASGTRSAAPGLALVGERGRELVDFGRGGARVYTNRETEGLLGPKYEIHIHEARSEDTSKAVIRAMQYAETMAAL
ncbi:transglycosylase SLT domain-containing protein [Streptomyces sp. NPDC002698]|uniref:transglycosylase SLT domain-containing protein n=1 Tax=Streptomyces sp. NPDC002698 TaxID=3364660 RepID=UPI0036AE2D61